MMMTYLKERKQKINGWKVELERHCLEKSDKMMNNTDQRTDHVKSYKKE